MVHRRPKKMSRRGFIASGSSLGAGLALGPLVLQLSSCASDGGADDERGDSARSDDRERARGAIAESAVLLGLYQGDGANARAHHGRRRSRYDVLGACDRQAPASPVAT